MDMKEENIQTEVIRLVKRVLETPLLFKLINLKMYRQHMELMACSHCTN